MEVKHSLMWLEASLIHFLGIPIDDSLRFIPIYKIIGINLPRVGAKTMYKISRSHD